MNTQTKKVIRAIKAIRDLAGLYRQKAEHDTVLRQQWNDSADAWDRRADLFESLLLPQEAANDNKNNIKKAG